MTSLIACLSTGEGTWAHVAKLISEQEWGSIFLVANAYAAEKFKHEKSFSFIVIDPSKPIDEVIALIRSGIHGKISDFDVALNLVSGSGKEHMAVISAIMNEGLGFRLVAITKEGFKEI